VALPNGRFRRIIDKNSTIPLTKSFRLPAPRDPSAEFIEMDIFQGESEYIIDNEYLGSLRVPVQAAGRKIDFQLSEECLLTVLVDLPQGPKEVELATRDTPPALKQALLEDAKRREAAVRGELAAGEEKRGLLSSIRRFWGG
jgi:molecular chaperone DnaK